MPPPEPYIDHIKKAKTGKDVRRSVRDVKSAVRPNLRSAREGLSLLVAVGAGAAVAWRSFQAGRDVKKAGEANTSPQELGRKPQTNGKNANGKGANGKAIAAAAQQAQKLRSGEATAEMNAARRARQTAAAPGTAKPVRGTLGMAGEFVKRFQDDEVPTRSYALSFIAILSLVPLLLVAVGIASFLIHSPAEAEDIVRRLVGSLLPGQQGSQAANEFIQNAHISESAQTLMNAKWVAAVGGAISLVWAASGLFVAASDPMNKAWDVQESRSFVALRGTALGVFLGTVAFFGLSLFVTSGAHGALASLGIPDNLPIIGAFLVDLVFFALAVAVNTVLFTLIYRFLPNAPVTWKSALFGGVVVGVLWELFKQFFAWYLAHFANMNKTYGALGGVFLLITWISYSCLILLVGAILCKMYHEHKEGNGVTPRPIRA